jgi:hypothetical protein
MTSSLRSLFGGFDLLVDPLELTDQLDREPATGLPDEVAGLDGRGQDAGLVGGATTAASPPATSGVGGWLTSTT